MPRIWKTQTYFNFHSSPLNIYNYSRKFPYLKKAGFVKKYILLFWRFDIYIFVKLGDDKMLWIYFAQKVVTLLLWFCFFLLVNKEASKCCKIRRDWDLKYSSDGFLVKNSTFYYDFIYSQNVWLSLRTVYIHLRRNKQKTPQNTNQTIIKSQKYLLWF